MNAAIVIRAVQALTTRYYVRGLPRLLWAARRMLSNASATYRLADGHRMRLSADDYFQWMMLWGYYSPHIHHVITDYLDAGDVCLDVGGHVGHFSLAAANRVGPSGLVVAVEADPRAARQLRDNAERTGAAQIRVVEKMIGGEHGEKPFRLASQLGWSTALSSGVPMVEESVLTREVVTVDSLVHQYVTDGRRVRLVKLDVEGSEVEALRGAVDLIASRSSAWVVEVNEVLLRASGNASDVLLAPIFDAGYTVMAIDEKRGPLHRTGAYSLRQLTRGEPVAGDVLALPH